MRALTSMNSQRAFEGGYGAGQGDLSENVVAALEGLVRFFRAEFWGHGAALTGQLNRRCRDEDEGCGNGLATTPTLKGHRQPLRE